MAEYHCKLCGSDVHMDAVHYVWICTNQTCYSGAVPTRSPSKPGWVTRQPVLPLSKESTRDEARDDDENAKRRLYRYGE